MYDGNGFPPYVPVAERRARAQRQAEQLKKRGQKTTPVVIEGRQIARTFWGKAWCQSLETRSDLGRLERGRSYVRNGSVVDLQIQKGRVAARVSGTRMYKVEITITRLEEDRWQSIVKACAGKIDSLIELLTGKISAGVMEVLSRQDAGLFPAAAQVRMSCSCPDAGGETEWLCKHLAAVLYGIGARLDHEPELLFVLRGVDQLELIGGGANAGGTLTRSGTRADLEGESLSALFGIELDAAPTPKAASDEKPAARKPAKAGSKPRRASPRRT